MCRCAFDLLTQKIKIREICGKDLGLPYFPGNIELMKNDELTFKQTKSCYLIVSGMSLKSVSESVGVSETTLFRWLKLPAFQDELRQLKRIVIERSLGKLQVLNDKSIQTLERLLTCGNYPTECRAAVAILTKNHEAIDFFEYESRLAKIESRFNENG
jgi:hypothetical protein